MANRFKLGILLSAALTSALTFSMLPGTAFAANPSASHPGGFIIGSAPAVKAKSGIIAGGTNATLPDSVDLTQWTVTAGDQGSYASCTAWAVGHSILGWYANKLGTPTTLAPMYIYSQTHINNTAGGGGAYTNSAFDVASSQGVATEADYPATDFSTPPTAAQQTKAAPYKTLGYSQLFFAPSGNAGTNAQAQIETALASGSPVGLAIPIYNNFYYLNSTNYNFNLANATGSILDNHYLAVFGYDSTGITVENSWSTSWGKRGFAHIGWDFVNSKALEGEAVYGFAASTLPSTAAPAPTPTTTSSPAPTNSPSPSSTPTTTTSPTPTPAPTTTQTAQPSPTPTKTVVTEPTKDTTVTPEPSPTKVQETTKPSVPSSVTYKTTSTSVKLSWQKPVSTGNTNITGYRVNLTQGKTTRIINLPASSTSLALSKLNPSTKYEVSVAAHNVKGYSAVLTKTIKTPVLHYPSCKAVKKAYSGGIAKASITSNKVHGKSKALKGVVLHNSELYNANKKLDTDRDGILCEKN
jgi:outer membrane biosynthesis protein TonB